jgi:hypothetical protein
MDSSDIARLWYRRSRSHACFRERRPDPVGHHRRWLRAEACAGHHQDCLPGLALGSGRGRYLEGMEPVACGLARMLRHRRGLRSRARRDPEQADLQRRGSAELALPCAQRRAARSARRDRGLSAVRFAVPACRRGDEPLRRHRRRRTPTRAAGMYGLGDRVLHPIGGWQVAVLCRSAGLRAYSEADVGRERRASVGAVPATRTGSMTSSGGVTDER